MLEFREEVGEVGAGVDWAGVGVDGLWERLQPDRACWKGLAGAEGLRPQHPGRWAPVWPLGSHPRPISCTSGLREPHSWEGPYLGRVLCPGVISG